MTKGNLVRIMFGIDKQANGAAPDASMVFDETNIITLHSFNNLSNKGRFITLYDKFHTFFTTEAFLSSTAVHLTYKNFNFYKKMRVPIVYDSNLGAITERCCNNFFICAVAEKYDISTPFINHVQLAFAHRIRFMDI